jgi:hypothetical protein
LGNCAVSIFRVEVTKLGCGRAYIGFEEEGGGKGANQRERIWKMFLDK